MTDNSLAKEMEKFIYQTLPLVEAIQLKVDEARKGFVKTHMARSPLIVNHIDAFHAGALYTFAEAAAALAVATCFDLSQFVLINKRGEIKYKKLVTERVVCEINFAEERIASIIKAVEQEGKTVFPLELFLENPDGAVAAEVVFDFYMRKTD